MKNSSLLLLLIGCFQSLWAQNDSIDIQFAPTLTAMGKPVGDKVRQPIDKEGGRIVSADKMVELVIPPDALTQTTDISIQPVANMLSDGHHSAYQLEPSGLTFLKPLQLLFHYAASEGVATPELRNIAWQDDKGRWTALDSSLVDTISRTVSGHITHFSTWVFFDYFNLTPASASVKVSRQIQLQVVCTYPGGLSDDFKGSLLSQLKFSTYVNGIRGGNAVVGKVTPLMGAQEFRVVNFTAPASVPDDNPVAVSVEASNVQFNRRKFSKLKLVSNLLIYDKAYQIKVKGYNQQSVLNCKVTSMDSSSCTVALKGKHSSVGDIQNMNIQVAGTKCTCPVTEINAGNNTGPIDIEGASKIEITPANPPQQPFRVITVYFIRHMGIIPGWHAPPCGHTNDVVTPPMPIPALPFVLAWEDDDKEHLFKGGDDKNGFEIRVIPVKDKD